MYRRRRCRSGACSAPIGRDEAELGILDTLLRRAQLRLTPAAAATRVCVEDVARSELDPRLLGLENPIWATRRLQPVAMRLAILAAEQAAGAVFDAVACRIADGGPGGLDDQLQLPARAAAVLSVAAAVRAKLV